MNHSQSELYFSESTQLLAGGVNSPVRAYKAVGGTPRVMQEGHGAELIDIDGNRYIDYVCAYGAILLGHNNSDIFSALVKTAANGVGFAAPHQLEVKLAKLITEMIPGAETVRLLNSGTEACSTAIRLARGVTGRNKIVKFAGCYHGHIDSLLVEAGSGAMTFGTPTSKGVSRETVQDTLVAQYNDLDSVVELFEKNGGEIAAVIMEPIAGNMGMVLPHPGFLDGVQALCKQHDTLLIMDEVMTGFRVSAFSAQAYYDICGDITVLGKVMGGGLPVAAVASSHEIMAHLSPQGPVYQAGTLSGNPLTCAAGCAALEHLKSQPELFKQLHKRSKYLVKNLEQLAALYEIPFFAAYKGGMFGFFFHPGPVETLSDVKASDAETFRKVFHHLLDHGIHLAPSPYEASFLTLAHSDKQLDMTLEHFESAFKSLKS